MTGPTFAFVFIAGAALVLYLVMIRTAVRPFTVTLVWMLPFTFGIAFGPSGIELETVTVLTYVLCFLFLVLGYVIADRSPRARSLSRRVVGPDVALYPTTVLVVFSALALYHFGRAGFSVFSEQTALDRWDFQRSGLFGLPARAFQIGVPIAVIMGFRSSWSDTAKRRRILYAVLVLWSLGWLLSGFKSGLLQGVFIGYAAIWIPAFEASVRKRTRIILRFAALGALAMFAAGYLLLTTSLGDRITLAERVIDTPSRAAATALNQIEDGIYLGDKPTYVTELEILARRSIPVVPDDGRLVFNELSSGNSTGRLDPGQFRSPVTPSGPATAIYNFGLLAPLWMLGVGAAYRFCEVLAGNVAGRPFVRVLATIGIVGLHGHLTKGGFAFFVFNWAAMLVLAWLVGRALPLGARASQVAASPDRPARRLERV